MSEVRTRVGRIATTGVMLAIFSGMSALALGFPQKAAFAPLLIGIPGAVLCLAQLVIDLRARRAAGAPSAAPDAQSAKADGEVMTAREWFMFAWLASFTAAIVGFGFHVGGTVAVLVYLRYASHEPWRNAVLGAAGTFLTFWLIFDKLLELSLFEGLILGRLI